MCFRLLGGALDPSQPQAARQELEAGVVVVEEAVVVVAVAGEVELQPTVLPFGTQV
jgi:hypothetical protein